MLRRWDLVGWLHVRFIGMRAKSLWNEYVLKLAPAGLGPAAELPELLMMVASFIATGRKRA